MYTLVKVTMQNSDLLNTWSRDHLYVLYVGILVKGPVQLYTQVQDLIEMIKFQ